MNTMQKILVSQIITTFFVLAAITFACFQYNAESSFIVVCILSPGLMGLGVAFVLVAIVGKVAMNWRARWPSKPKKVTSK